ncbi:hypothetical protein [Pedobacter sp. Leaf41]|uniref:hypothetical protein n=1 Tax=Pedobacter sp. Leaf41 TaxID=1736218 RepID=UPI000A9CBCB8|nr:hypothetical protein [Pedobacter sp. Leaf41]
MNASFSVFRYMLILVALTVTSQKLSAQQKSILETVDKHQQIYPSSCIPSSIEMILKYNNKVGINYFNLQHGWKNRNDGSFDNFDGKTINGLKFRHQFQNKRGVGFPLDELYKTISDELANRRKVVISLVSGQGMWHIWVIDGKTESGDFIAYSRDFNNGYTMAVADVKKRVKAMQGTDIITYSSSKK